MTDTVHPVIGFSTGAKNEKEAMASAVQDCLSKGGKECQSDMFTYHNECAVLMAKKSGGVHYSYGPELEGAEEIGMRGCQKNGEVCKVIYTHCSYAEAVPVH